MSRTRTLIVNADDFGRTPGLSDGILQAHRDGIVTSTTVMVNYPHAEAVVRRARTLSPELGIGIHLNLTAGEPILPPRKVPDLVGPDGRFLPVRKLIPRLDQLDGEQVAAELEAQVERFRFWGAEPTHLDVHHHLLYLSPRLFAVLVDLAQAYGLPIRYPWPQAPIDAQALSWLAEAHRVPVDRLPGIIRGCNAIMERAPVVAPDACILSFYGAGATLEHLLHLIVSLPDGVTELMCHPGRADRCLRAESGYVEEREQELAVLTDPRVRETLAVHGVRLSNFRALRLL